MSPRKWELLVVGPQIFTTIPPPHTLLTMSRQFTWGDIYIYDSEWEYLCQCGLIMQSNANRDSWDSVCLSHPSLIPLASFDSASLKCTKLSGQTKERRNVPQPTLRVPVPALEYSLLFVYFIEMMAKWTLVRITNEFVCPDDLLSSDGLYLSLSLRWVIAFISTFTRYLSIHSWTSSTCTWSDSPPTNQTFSISLLLIRKLINDPRIRRQCGLFHSVQDQYMHGLSISIVYHILSYKITLIRI